ncbi:MAG TPA: hypothetical protein PLK63_16625, partial [Catalimonadaceae bacterium]|nr:hypothetical protein [Catalimonadaceae bacterium]
MKTLSYEGRSCLSVKLLFSFLLMVSPSAFCQTWENLTHERPELPYQPNTDKTVLASGLTGPWSFSKNICGYGIAYQMRKYANGIWEDKGAGLNLEFRNTYTDRFFTIDKRNDIPYIISGYPAANVLRYTDSDGWQPVGNSNFTGPSLDPTITVDHNGVPYVGYIEGNHTARVMKLNTSTNLWEEILSESYYPEVLLYSIVKTDTLGNVYTATMTEAGKTRISGQTMFESGGLAMDFDVCDDGAFSFGQDGNPLYFRSQPLTDALGDPILCYGKSFFDHFRNTAYGAYTLDASDPRFANPNSYYKLNLHSKTIQGQGSDAILSLHNGASPNLGISFDGKFSCFFWDSEFDYSTWFMPVRLINRWRVAGEGADNPATWKKFLSSNSDLTSFHNKTAVVYSNESNHFKPTALVYENGIWQSLFLETMADSAKEVQAEYDPNGNLVVAIVNNMDSLILYTHATGGGWTEHGGPTRDQMRDPDKSPDALHCKVGFIALKLQPQTGIPYLFFGDRCFGGQGSVMKYTGQWEFAGNRGLTIGTTSGAGYNGVHNRIDFLVEGGQSVPVVLFSKALNPESIHIGLCIQSLSSGNGDWAPFRGDEFLLAASAITDADLAIKDTLIYIVSSGYYGDQDFSNDLNIMTYKENQLVFLNQYDIGISPGAVAITIDSLNQPFVAFASNSSCFTGSVIKLDHCNQTWKVVGQPNVIPPSNNVNLCILSNGNSIGSYDTRDDVVGVNFIQHVSGPQPSLPSIALGPDSNYFCPGDTVTLAINQGDLNLAAHWAWYKGSCGGELLGTGNSVRISPTDTTTYFVRGEGGTADRCGCTSVTMYMNTVIHTFYLDADGDSFGNPAIDTLSCHSIPGYVLNHLDCNDANAQMHSSFLFFVDGDLDGYGSADTARVCAVNANTPPAGYSLDNTDCNDQLSSVHTSFLFYTDADQDGFGSAISELLCASGPNSAPSGYSS